MKEQAADKDSIIFDQYSRYRACADILSHVTSLTNVRLLDVGSGPECLLERFIPEADITFIDQQFPTDDVLNSSSRIAGDILQIELAENSFDFVVSIDTLEHIQKESREIYLEKLSTVAADGIIIAFPYSDDDVAEHTDRFIDAVYRREFGTGYFWLDEHFKYSLPSRQDVIRQLQEWGWQCHTVGHGYVPWLKELLSLSICLLEIPEGKELVLEMSATFNRNLYPYDFCPPYYRTFVVAVHDDKKIEPFSFPASHPKEIKKIYHNLVSRYRDQIMGLCLELHQSRNHLLLEKKNLEQERNSLMRERDSARQLQAAAEKSLAEMRSNSSQLILHLLRNKYHRMPLPFFARKILSTCFHGVRRSINQILMRKASGEQPFVAPDVVPKERQESNPDYIIWGVINWHFRLQRPQHIARALADKGRRVFYISAQIRDDPRPGFEVKSLDNSGRLFEIYLYALRAPVIYHTAPDTETVRHLRRSVGQMILWADISTTVSLVQHPFWCDIATSIPGSRLVYDCMDFHEGFGNTSDAVLKLEQQLLKLADLTIVTSNWLEAALGPQSSATVLVRNACDFDHFSRKPDQVYSDPEGRPVIGYFGAIAEWFDQDLVEAVARRFSDCSILLLGADTVGAHSRLQRIGNVTMTGEVPFSELPFYLYGFDVCLLPFRIIPLTQATNPVKVYEYLCAGKPVVAVNLPEMAQFGDLVRVADTKELFLDEVEKALAEPDDSKDVHARREYARQQTWQHRVADLVAEVEENISEPIVSIIIVTYNNLALTRECLESVDIYRGFSNQEIIVVDNRSEDGTREFLQQWVSDSPSDRKVIFNEDNLGFAAANNQGMAAAKGEFLVLLNNDTYVTPGWLQTLMNHLRRDKTIGIIGPVTNNIGNEAKIDIFYSSMEGMIEAARRYTCNHLGEVFDLRTVAFFCVMFRRSVYEAIGLLDEAFGLGFFEDDDYCRRIEEAGMRIVCAEDVFVHHHLSASFDKIHSKKRQELFERNKKIYEEKWGAWEPHVYR